MITTKLALAALITVALVAAPFSAEAKRSSRPVRHHSARVLAPAYGGGVVAPVAPPATSPSYGSSGQSVGTVTAPSIGTYNWPSVGVTNAVPTWSNTNPPAR